METIDKNVISIHTEATPNPDTMKFVVSKMILPNDSADYRDKTSAEDSPLATALFGFDNVNGVFIMNNFVSVTKKADAEWFDMIPQLKDSLQKFLESGQNILEKRQELSEEEENEVVGKIKKLLEDHVRPAVEMDGGAIDFQSFENGIVTVSLKGACSGCPSSTITLKAGIENLLKRMVPEVTEVVAEAH